MCKCFHKNILKIHPFCVPIYHTGLGVLPHFAIVDIFVNSIPVDQQLLLALSSDCCQCCLLSLFVGFSWHWSFEFLVKMYLITLEESSNLEKTRKVCGAQKRIKVFGANTLTFKRLCYTMQSISLHKHQPIYSKLIQCFFILAFCNTLVKFILKLQQLLEFSKKKPGVTPTLVDKNCFRKKSKH